MNKTETLALAALLVPASSQASCVSWEMTAAILFHRHVVQTWESGILMALIFVLVRISKGLHRRPRDDWHGTSKVLATGLLGVAVTHATMWAWDASGEYWWVPFGVYLVLGVPAMLTWTLWAFYTLLLGLND